HHHAHDAHHDARSAASGLHPHSLGERSQRTPHRDPPCVAQCADPGRHPHRSAGTAAAQRRGDSRADLRHPRHRHAAARCRQYPGLSHRHWRLPCRRPGRDAGQRRRRSQLRLAGSESEVSLMSAVLPQVPVRTNASWQMPGWPFIKRLFREKPLGAFGAVVFVLFILCGVFADFLAPYGLNQISPLNRLKAPSLAFPFGTDYLGRDMLSRTLYGAQLSVIIGVAAALLATVISVILGTLSGYVGGRSDMVTQRFVDSWMSFPDLVILIVIVSVFGPGMTQIVIALGLLMGIGGSRIIRSAVLSVR